MTFKWTHKRTAIVLVVSLAVLAGFAAGFVACLDLKATPPTESLKQQMLLTGDAPPAVRAGVLDSLRAFQAGYEKRDCRTLDSFMNNLFVREDDVLIIGTQAGASEWARGYSAAAQFIQRDWQKWGDFRFDVDHSVVWSWEMSPGLRALVPFIQKMVTARCGSPRSLRAMETVGSFAKYIFSWTRPIPRKPTS